MASKSLPKNEGSSSPDQIGVPGGGSASRDHLYDIFQRLSSIESSLTFITASVDDSKVRIEAVSKDLVEAKVRFDALKTVAKSASKGIWAVFLLLLSFCLTVFGFWLKHHMNW